MADIDLKTATPDTTINTSAFLFGADSQSASNPSVYAVSTVKAAIIGAGDVSVASGKTLTASNTLTLAGTDGTTMTFPSTSTTLAGLGIANSFTTAQTITPLSDAAALTVRRNSSSQTSKILQIQTEANAALADFDKDGLLTVPGVTVSSGSITLSGNISSAAWTTNGIRYKNVAATLTDTSSSGTVSTAYTNVFGGNTIAASNSTTFTDYYTTYVTQPTAGTNVTFTRRWAQGFGGSILITGGATLPLQTLTDGTNVAWDCSAGAKAKVTLGGNRTMSAVTNAVEGTSYTLWVIQDATGSRTLSWTTSGAGSFDFGTEGTPVLTTTASAADLLAFEAVSIGGTLKLRFCGIKRGFA